MAALGSPARTLRGLLRELRYLSEATGRPYRDTAAYRYLVKAFRAHRRERERQRHRKKEKQAPCQEPDVGLDPKTPGSGPGPKAGAKLLSHPGIPESCLLRNLQAEEP
ncbi:Protein FMC1 homolog [Vulpes lagopus]